MDLGLREDPNSRIRVNVQLTVEEYDEELKIYRVVGDEYSDDIIVPWNDGPIALGLLCASKIPPLAKRAWGMSND